MHLNLKKEDFFIFTLIIVTLAFFDILSPYFSTILWSAILTVIFYPIKRKLQVVLGKRNKLASLLTTCIICLIVFIPLTIIISSLAIELNIIYTKLHHNNTQFPEMITWLFSHLPKWSKLFLAEYNINNAEQIQQKLSKIILKGGQYLLGSAFLIGKGTFGFAIRFAIMLYLLFFLLKDGPYIVKKIINYLPLSNIAKQHLFIKFAVVSKAIVKGTIIVSVIQGTLGSIAFYVVGIDGSILLGAIMGLFSLIPVIGLAVIWIPISFYLFATNQLWKGLFIVCFFIMVISLIDNFLRPILVRKDTKMPDYLILIATLGGVELYSINGFIIGPLIAALFITCWSLFSNQDNLSNDNIKNIFFDKKNKHKES